MWMTLVRISDPSLLQLLCADLMSRDDLIAETVNANTVQVDILGSYGAEAMKVATLLRLRAWEADQRTRGVQVSVDIVD